MYSCLGQNNCSDFARMVKQHRLQTPPIWVVFTNLNDFFCFPFILPLQHIYVEAPRQLFMEIWQDKCGDKSRELSCALELSVMWACTSRRWSIWKFFTWKTYPWYEQNGIVIQQKDYCCFLCTLCQFMVFNQIKLTGILLVYVILCGYISFYTHDFFIFSKKKIENP